MDHRLVAALSGNRLIVHNGLPRERLLLPSQYRDTAALVGYCAAEGIRAVWLTGGQGPPVTAPAGWRAHSSRPQGHEGYTVYRFRPWSDPEGRRAVMLHRHDPRWGWHDIIDPDALPSHVTAYEAAMGLPCGYSPASDALTLLADTNRKHPDWLAYERGDAPLAQDRAPRWCRPLPAPHRDDRLWLYDVNAAYLAAAQGLSFGAGAPSPIPAPRQKREPGVVMVIEAGRAREDSPRPVSHRAIYDRATLDSARSCGQGLGVRGSSGWAWPVHHQAMRHWAERLWAARESLPPGPARDTIKLAYTTIWGVMNRPESPRHYRPHWVSAVVAEQARRRYADYARLTALGIPVVLLRVDTIGVVGAEPTRAVTESTLRMGGLGGYKRLGSAPLTPELRDLARRGDVGGMVRYVEENGDAPD